ncbi:MAG: hypothetical protein ACR2PZ_26565 [Pseudomonadales bacterium]
MPNRSPLLSVSLLLFVATWSFAPDIDARKKLLGDKSGSTAYMEVKTQNPAELADTLVKVFSEDGYDVASEVENRIKFARLASRMQELSYGTPLAPGSLESVTVDYFPISQTKYRIECNVTIITGAEVSAADANVLPLFGRQYKRMLRRVKRALR